ncbi:MAG: bifunctional 5,10-methylenetetrahydrofolate dehydrogenase/5,10-methenyltetrahydrofolate cyclohydrolase [Phycisphaerales bacterium]
MPRAITIDGKAIASQVKAGISRRVEALRAKGFDTRLDAVIVTDEANTAAGVYAMNQKRACNQLGIDYVLHELKGSSSYQDIAGRVLLLNSDPEVHAIMVHMPLPEGVDPFRIQSLIAPDKDVEGVNPANIGNIVYARSSLAPCTAMAAVKLINSTGIDLKGKRCVIVGASNIVGKPIAVMLMQPEATVISCNKYTENLPELAASADVVVAAAGVAHLVKKNWIKPGAIVIDVGIHRVPLETPLPDGTKMRTVGDVADDVAEVAGYLSPVPGGVGPVTVAMLLENVVTAAERHHQ